jgi:hypothetical protein
LFESEGQKGSGSCSFKKPAGTNAQSMMPRWQTRGVQREPCLARECATESFAACQNCGSLGTKADCFTQFFEVPGLQFFS